MEEHVDASFPLDEAGPPKTGSVMHFLYFPAEANAGRVASILEKQGYRVETEPGTETPDFLVTAVRELLLTRANLLAVQLSLTAFASEWDGVYDGWEVDVRKLR